jgi:hypothetical protein
MDHLKLDSFSQYYVRKLLRQYIKTPHSRVSQATDISRYFNIDLNLLIADTCSTSDDLPGKFQKLEMLIQVHQETPQRDQQALLGLERQILELVGLRLYSPDQEVRRGVRYKNEIYGLILESRLEKNPRILKLILVLLEWDIPFIVTHSKEHYAVWLNLRSPAYKTLITDDFRLIHKVLSLRHKLQRLKPVNLHKIHHPSA